MIDPGDLLDHSETLLSGGVGAPPQVKLRRAVSSAYYAIFHHLLRDAADEFVGKNKRSSPHYALLYRSFEHRGMKERASEAAKSQLSQKLRQALGIASFQNRIRQGAAAFVELQRDRHNADYHPQFRLTLETARSKVAAAKAAISLFKKVPKNEYRLFLAYLLFDVRT